MGQTARRPAIFNVSSNTQRYVVPLFVVAGAFVLGWWMGRDGSDVAQPPAGPASAGPPSAGPSAVKLVLDAAAYGKKRGHGTPDGCLAATQLFVNVDPADAPHDVLFGAAESEPQKKPGLLSRWFGGA